MVGKGVKNIFLDIRDKHGGGENCDCDDILYFCHTQGGGDISANSLIHPGGDKYFMFDVLGVGHNDDVNGEDGVHRSQDFVARRSFKLLQLDNSEYNFIESPGFRLLLF